MSELKIKIKRLHKKYSDIPLPKYETADSSGMDVRAAVEKEEIIKAGEVKLIHTNLSVEIPAGYEIQVRPRSGLAAKYNIGVLNSPGTIDADYRGEIKIILFNFGKEDFVIRRGYRIAQLVVGKIYKANLIESDELNSTPRGSGGFGHTGEK